ncbi:MAG: D-alanine--D-alanine ligase [Chloroflexi bacterium ADurb.Bin360]|nr:MAG: D-alanine--D-alanine ligase [Chloroflexi bacterium ADurb.Bin360]
MADRLKVAVLLGGRSGEHEVSLASASSVMSALDPGKYEIIQVGITRQGAWVAGTEVLAALQSESLEGVPSVALFADPTRRGLWDVESLDGTARLRLFSRVDVVFPVLHGTFGEDGTLQGLLEMADVPYVGCGALASAVAMDKVLFKDVCKAHDLPMAAYVGVSRRRWEHEPQAVLDEIEQVLHYPLFTKPANLGSSVGISKCRGRSDLLEGLHEAARYDRRILVEQAVPAAREIEVSVLGNEAPSASVPGEIIPSREFYDYAAKYLDEGERASQLLIPAPISAALTEQVRDLAIRAYRAIDGAGMARADFLLDGESGALYLNELNTIPGFTKISMYPKLWEATGIPYSQLLSWLIDLALDRHGENMRSERVYRPLA